MIGSIYYFNKTIYLLRVPLPARDVYNIILRPLYIFTNFFDCCHTQIHDNINLDNFRSRSVNYKQCLNSLQTALIRLWKLTSFPAGFLERPELSLRTIWNNIACISNIQYKRLRRYQHVGSVLVKVHSKYIKNTYSSVLHSHKVILPLLNI